jgi:hypothetical protein
MRQQDATGCQQRLREPVCFGGRNRDDAGAPSLRPHYVALVLPSSNAMEFDILVSRCMPLFICNPIALRSFMIVS